MSDSLRFTLYSIANLGGASLMFVTVNPSAFSTVLALVNIFVAGMCFAVAAVAWRDGE